jgi:hypothetical protein
MPIKMSLYDPLSELEVEAPNEGMDEIHWNLKDAVTALVNKISNSKKIHPLKVMENTGFQIRVKVENDGDN